MILVEQEQQIAIAKDTHLMKVYIEQQLKIADMKCKSASLVLLP